MEARRRNTPRDLVKSGRVAKHDDSLPVLACNQCRSKKVKCVAETDSCQRCNRLKIECSWPSRDQRKVPSSKSHIHELNLRISYLESALAAATGQIPEGSSHSDGSSVRGRSLLPPDSPSSPSYGGLENIISRLCGRQWRLNGDEDGEYRFYGPTSSFHLTESNSKKFPRAGPRCSIIEDSDFGGRIGPGTQEHLLAVYFKNQPTAIQMIDQEEFIMGLRSGQSRYFSKALLCTVYACAARISDRPEVRALVIPSRDGLEDEQPFLMATASKLLDDELKKPQVTTVQALLLFSVVHCALSNDSKGWLLVGNACRLAVDLGLHITTEQMASMNLAPRDIKVRRLTFFACLIYDRLWALYLGRPVCLHGGIAELEKSPISHEEVPWEMRTAESWARLLVTVGRICEALNGEQCNDDAVDTLDSELQHWYHCLQPGLCYSPGAHSSVLLLHMQFYSTKIILHQAAAGFGSTPTQPLAQRDKSKQICIDNAKNIARALQGFRLVYGEATTMSGVVLHIIGTASTILIVCIAEKRLADLSGLRAALETCMKTLSELERTYPVARRVRRILRNIMNLYYLDLDSLDAQQDTNSTASALRLTYNQLPVEPVCGASESFFDIPEGNMTSSSLSRWDFLNPGYAAQGPVPFEMMYDLEF